MKKLLFTLIVSAFVYICGYAQKAPLKLSAKRLDDLAYGSFASSRMDVYLPEGRNPKTPFVIILHGGAWTLGHRDWGRRTQDSLSAHGIASANIEYRYADDSSTHYGELLKDIDSVIIYCRAHAKEWNTRRKGFIMNGESAGGHLALLYGYTTRNKISAIIAECAPVNVADTGLLNLFRSNGGIQAISKMVGAEYVPSQPVNKLFVDASPLFHIKNIPTLFFHGTADQTVPYSQALQLDEALKSKGYTYKFVPMPGAGHDAGFNSASGRTKIYGEIVAWVWRYGK